MEIHATLWPSFEHFEEFSTDDRIQGIRLNSAMTSAAEIDSQFASRCEKATVPLWFDIKGMQLRIKEVLPTKDHLEFILNRPIDVKTPCVVEFKAGQDYGLCTEIKNGNHFIFSPGPQYQVKAGESIHIKQPCLPKGPTFLDYEIEKINKVVSLGFDKFYLSYVYSDQHVMDFRKLIGPDAKLILKIENKEGLDWIEKSDVFLEPNTFLAAARGDLFVEVDKPHHILEATRSIIHHDPEAIVGSRMMLSVIPQNPKVLEFLQFAKLNGLDDVANEFKKSIQIPAAPSCADLCELAWLYDIGYRKFLLCDELCLQRNLLNYAINVLCAFRKDYDV